MQLPDARMQLKSCTREVSMELIYARFWIPAYWSKPMGFEQSTNFRFLHLEVNIGFKLRSVVPAKYP